MLLLPPIRTLLPLTTEGHIDVRGFLSILSLRETPEILASLSLLDPNQANKK